MVNPAKKIIPSFANLAFLARAIIPESLTSSDLVEDLVGLVTPRLERGERLCTHELLHGNLAA
jgi:hypothetical protein